MAVYNGVDAVYAVYASPAAHPGVDAASPPRRLRQPPQQQHTALSACRSASWSSYKISPTHPTPPMTSSGFATTSRLPHTDGP
eukprot:364707-Chlamydomonas_euryale.AAC.1